MASWSKIPYVVLPALVNLTGALLAVATIYAGLGQKEEALPHLAKAHEEGSYYMIHLKVEPLLDPLRSDPRFSELMRKVGHVR